jgi:hypothetical protein
LVLESNAFHSQPGRRFAIVFGASGTSDTGADRQIGIQEGLRSNHFVQAAKGMGRAR